MTTRRNKQANKKRIERTLTAFMSPLQTRFGSVVVIVAVVTVTTTVTALVLLVVRRQRCRRTTQTTLTTTKNAYEELIGNTPLVQLYHLSRITKRKIFVKMESLNPGGTGKDRAALAMIIKAESNGGLPPPSSTTASIATSMTTLAQQHDNEKYDCILLFKAMQTSRTGGLVVEGTSGSTGISLAALCAARGHACLVVVPDDQAMEKTTLLTTLGAIVHTVPTAAISNPNHYVNEARRLAQTARNKFNISAVFMDQFENEANYNIHYTTTGPELYRQCPTKIDAFCMSAGTGGTIAGVGRFLNTVQPKVRIVLVDPPGSSLYHQVTHGILYAPQQSERRLQRHRYDTIAEGIGLDRMTRNLQHGIIHQALTITDQEAVDMAHYILHHEGLWVGSSSSMNVVGACRTALDLPEGATVVTIICDGGHRHVTRFWNQNFIEQRGLKWPGAAGEQRVPECFRTILQ